MKKEDVKIIGEGRYARLVSKDGWEWAQRKNITGIVSLVAITSDDKIVLTEQFRAAVAKPVIELPAGLVGDVAGSENESLLTAAKRELLEETGYEAAHFSYLTAGPPSSGLTSEIITLFLAQGLRKVSEGGGDASENITVHEVPLAKIDKWLNDACQDRQVLIDPKIYAGVYLAISARTSSPSPSE